MEEVYPRDLDKNVPELFLRKMGKSRIAYDCGLRPTRW